MIRIRVFNTPVKIRLVVLANIVVLWAVTSWVGLTRYPDRDLLWGIIIGLFAMILLLIADIGHATAHIFSARRAGAPMDEIRISAGMPQTIYRSRDVSPSAHRMRALGGPAFSATGLLLSLIVYGLASSVPIARELAAWSAIGHGLILGGCLLPIPVVDGGAILKWTLVKRGMTEPDADRRVRQVNWIPGAIGLIAGLLLIGLQVWLLGLVLLGVGVISIAVAAGWIF